MATIKDLITSKFIGSYWEEYKNNQKPFFGEGKFPNQKKLGLDLNWIKGADKAPVMLMPSAFDAKVIPISRQGLEITKTQMPFFKNDIHLDENDRQNIMLLQQANSDALNTAIQRVFDDATRLLDNASITREVMRMQALTTGAISISSNGQSLSYDYGVPAANKKAPTIKWDVSDTCDPIGDIRSWKLQMANKGYDLTEMLLNSVTLAYIQKAKSVKDLAFANVTNTPAIMSIDAVTSIIKSETEVDVYVYDKGYTTEAGVFTKFVADGTVVLMPSNELGNTWFGTTPEEADLMYGNTKADVSIVDTGVAITTWVEVDPVNVRTKASEICLPSFEGANSIIIASVKTA